MDGTLSVSRGPRGPSPRVRGSRLAITASFTTLATGSIPACAGKPSRPAPRGRGTRVHPRVCGEATRATPPRRPLWGPSPRVRGSLLRRRREDGAAGSIPACAGKPRTTTAKASMSRVHPRVCGEALAAVDISAYAAGPSPRVRGSRERGGRLPLPEGVHPRVCGEAGLQAHEPRAGVHRVRGSLVRDFRAAVVNRVHPRVCGEAALVYGRRLRQPGPSPRVRGSRNNSSLGGSCGGDEVHPRVCGEAS